MDNCIFCKIIQGKIPSHKVWEDDKNLAFLTIRPHTEGHTLLIPKLHEDYLFNLSDQDYNSLMLAAKQLSMKLQKVFKPTSGKVGVIVAGLEVPHAHIHLIPLHDEKDLSFSNAHDADSKQLEQTLAKIHSV